MREKVTNIKRLSHGNMRGKLSCNVLASKIGHLQNVPLVSMAIMRGDTLEDWEQFGPIWHFFGLYI